MKNPEPGAVAWHTLLYGWARRGTAVSGRPGPVATSGDPKLLLQTIVSLWKYPAPADQKSPKNIFEF
jgi:hypothetical protein